MHGSWESEPATVELFLNHFKTLRKMKRRTSVLLDMLLDFAGNIEKYVRDRDGVITEGCGGEDEVDETGKQSGESTEGRGEDEAVEIEFAEEAVETLLGGISNSTLSEESDGQLEIDTDDAEKFSGPDSA
jgi:hypothetical protein